VDVLDIFPRRSRDELEEGFESGAQAAQARCRLTGAGTTSLNVADQRS
jgi:hypothetical protein